MLLGLFVYIGISDIPQENHILPKDRKGKTYGI